MEEILLTDYCKFIEFVPQKEIFSFLLDHPKVNVNSHVCNFFYCCCPFIHCSFVMKAPDGKSFFDILVKQRKIGESEAIVDLVELALNHPRFKISDVCLICMFFL